MYISSHMNVTLKFVIHAESSPPTMLNATLVSSTSVSLSWFPPLTPLGTVISYTVHVVEGNNSHRILSTGHNRTELAVTDLYPGEEYSFTVAAVNGKGEGLQSRPVNTSTPLPGMNSLIVPSHAPLLLSLTHLFHFLSLTCPPISLAVLAPPGAPTVTHVNSTSITLEWGLPREFPQFVLFYVLQCTSQSRLAPAHTTTYTTNQTHATADHLVPYTEYTFMVAVVSGVGQGEWSNTTWQHTDAISE